MYGRRRYPFPRLFFFRPFIAVPASTAGTQPTPRARPVEVFILSFNYHDERLARGVRNARRLLSDRGNNNWFRGCRPLNGWLGLVFFAGFFLARSATFSLIRSDVPLSIQSRTTKYNRIQFFWVTHVRGRFNFTQTQTHTRIQQLRD